MSSDQRSGAKTPDAGRQRSMLHSCAGMLAVVVAMFAFGYAMVPLYYAVCRATGVGGKVALQAAKVKSVAVDTDRLVTVQFVTTVNGGRSWQFRAEQPAVQVHPGQLTSVSFYARNTEDRAIVAQAVPNIAPWNASRYLHKTECFCFNNQAFAAGEEKHMPVRFEVDPELPPDVDTVTLSYTFFDVTQTVGAADTAKPSPSAIEAKVKG